MKRLDVLQALMSRTGDSITVATMQAIPDWHGLGGNDRLHLDNFGCMGAASALGLGLALAQPERRIVVIDGDGSLLMQLGSLASIAGQAPHNFYHLVLVNHSYETSGGQPTPGGDGVSFAALAKGAGYVCTAQIHEQSQLADSLARVFSSGGPGLIEIAVDKESSKPFPRRADQDQIARLLEKLA